MIRSFVLTLSTLLIAMSAQGENLSSVVMKDKMGSEANYVFSNTSIDGLLTLVGPGYDQARQAQLVQYWDGVSLDNKSAIIAGLNRKEEGLIVAVNNQVWLDKEFKFLPQYVDALQSKFNVTPQVMDVTNPDQVAADVNQWAEDNTNKLIKNVLKPEQVEPNTVTILANAVYFKGEWDEKFDSADTVEADFYGVDSKVPSMTKDMNKTTPEGMPVYYDGVSVKTVMKEMERVLLVELPFKGKSHSLVIAMPAEIIENEWSADYVYDEGAGDVKAVFETYIANGQAFADLSNMGWERKYKKFQMPKFEVESEIKGVEGMLSDMGYSDLFQAGALSNMVDDPRAKLSQVFQKAKIIINEEGGEAAAVSIGIVVTESAVMIEGNLLINGPFAYAIRDNSSNVTLFEGIVTNPAK